ncbi:efflux RND transporter periplasmic adaptor subunit [Sediminibacterium salmoneum]|uniref:efflux RND transporter periplasmic adaptor subunit n=1 Tax=Sediminibacterium salmoneum TaxID=426421 RepID=UPI00047B8F24|nr:efflux RND transporter periplasmic adaptor subunit [Sediminibacterium salmoneum]
MKRFIHATLLMGAAIIIACNTKEEAKKEISVFQVTSPVQTDTLILKEYVAQIQSVNHIELRSQERGYLQKIFVDEGQFVKKGQLMFQIMPNLYQAEMQKAKAELNFAEIEYNNTRSLAENNIVSPNELALSKAKLNKARAELALAQTHLDFTEIKAPFGGIMDRFHTRLGSLIDEGELLTTLSDNNKMWVYFNVPEAEYLNYIQKNKRVNSVKLQLQMANKAIFDQEGIVETIEADFNNETGNIAFRATFPNPKRLLRHGETGNILMPVPLRNAILIPQKASFEVLDKKYVFVVDKDNIIHSQQITVEAEMPHLYVVSAGLKSSDKILLDGLRKVKNGDKITTQFASPKKVFAELHELHAE